MVTPSYTDRLAAHAMDLNPAGHEGGAYSTASQAGFSSDTYLTGSALAFDIAPVVGTLYRCTFDVAKTGAGTAAPVIIVRFGTAGTTSDSARLTFTFPAQTADADVGTFDNRALFRTIGGSGVLQGRASLTHTGGATGLLGLSVNPGPTLQVTSSGFDTAVAASIIGLSVNGGTSASWTAQLVEATVRRY